MEEIHLGNSIHIILYFYVMSISRRHPWVRDSLLVGHSVNIHHPDKFNVSFLHEDKQFDLNCKLQPITGTRKMLSGCAAGSISWCTKSWCHLASMQSRLCITPMMIRDTYIILFKSSSIKRIETFHLYSLHLADAFIQRGIQLSSSRLNSLV